MAHMYTLSALPELGMRMMLMPSTGFDRDLSMAGRVMVKDNNGRFVQRLFKIEQPSTTFGYHTRGTVNVKY